MRLSFQRHFQQAAALERLAGYTYLSYNIMEEVKKFHRSEILIINEQSFVHSHLNCFKHFYQNNLNKLNPRKKKDFRKGNVQLILTGCLVTMVLIFRKPYL